MRYLNGGRRGGGTWLFALSPDGRRLASGFWNGIDLWDLPSGELLTRVKLGIPGLPGGLSFTPDGRNLAAGVGWAILLWEVVESRGKVRLSPRSRTPPGVRGYLSLLWEPRRSPAQRATFPEELLPCWTNMAFLRGRPLYLVCPGKERGPDSPGRLTLTMTNLDGGGWIWPLAERGFWPCGFALCPAADRIAFSLGESLGIGIGRTDVVPEIEEDASTAPCERLPCEGSVREIRFDASGTTLAARTDEVAWVWDLPDPVPRVRVAAPAGGFGTIDLSPDGRLLLAAADGAIRTFDARSGAELSALDFDIGPVTMLRFAPDALTAMAGGEAGRLVIWDVR